MDKNRFVYVPVKKNRMKIDQPGQWSQRKKLEAVTMWVLTGNLTQTAVTLGVPLDTMRSWAKSQWWKDAVSTINDDDKQEIDAKYQKLIRKALAVVDDRLDKGNFVFDQKTGKVVRVPVSMRDSHTVVKDLVAQQQILRKDKTEVEVHSETINDKLVKLATQFAEMAMGNKIPKSSSRTYEMQLDALEIHNNGSEASYEALRTDNAPEPIPNPT